MTMKTKQEQIDKIQEIINDCYVVDSYIAAEGSEGGYIDAEEAAKAIVEAGYGKVSEYEAEIERLKAEVKQAQIDVLKKLKERAIGYTFLGEKLATETDIDELIKEVQNEN